MFGTSRDSENCDLGKYFACSAKQGFEVDELACCSEVSRQRAE
jgi:hypothetical protein